VVTALRQRRVRIKPKKENRPAKTGRFFICIELIDRYSPHLPLDEIDARARHFVVDRLSQRSRDCFGTQLYAL